MIGRPPRAFWVGFLGAVAGALLMLMSIHAWSDHQALHVLVNYLNEHAEKINRLP